MLLATLLAIVVGVAEGQSKPAPPTPPPLPDAKAPTSQESPRAPAAQPRTIEDGILDWVRLTDGGTRTTQTPIYIRLFSAEKANLGTGGDGGKEARTSEAKTMQGQGPTLLRDTFLANAKTAGLTASASDGPAATALPAEAIVIDGEFVTIDPGSRAKRYLVGFGAGKSTIEVAGRFLTGSGETVGEFKHRRVGAMGFGGGDSLGKLLADSKSCGEDIAKFMAAWLAGKPLN